MTYGEVGVADLPAVEAMWRRCSRVTRVRRFLGARGEARWLLGVGLDAVGPRVDLGAWTGRCLVGLGSLVYDAAGSWEVGLLVEDAWQRRSIGGSIADLLLDAARARGIDRLVFTTSSPDAVLPLVRSRVASCEVVWAGGGAVEYTALVAAVGEKPA
jgi:GNAT superfamily N-acetyltransferase